VADTNNLAGRSLQNDGQLYSRTYFNNAQRAAMQRLTDVVMGPLFAVDGSGNGRTVCFGDGLEVASAGGLDLDVAPGHFLQWVDEDQNADPYAPRWRRGRLAAAATLSLAAGGADPRIDIVQARADESLEDTISVPYMSPAGVKSNVPLPTRYADSIAVEVKQGTEAGSPSAPTPDPGFFVVAEIAVAAAALSVGGGDITDRRIAPVLQVPDGGYRLPGLVVTPGTTEVDYASALPQVFDELIATTLRATNKLVLRTQAGPDGARVLLQASKSGTQPGFFVHAFADGAAEAGETPSILNRLFGARKTSDGKNTETYLPGPQGTGNSLAADETVKAYIGGPLDWLLRASNDSGGVGRLLELLSPSGAERIGFLSDGRLRMARTGGGVPTLTVTRRLPLIAGRAGGNLVKVLELPGDTWLISAPGGAAAGSVSFSIPESYDSDGPTEELASVGVWVKNEDPVNTATVVLQFVRQANLGAEYKMPAGVDVTADIAGGAGAWVSAAVDPAFASTSEQRAFLWVESGSEHDLIIAGLRATYKVHRLPA
jgi:hypothetical protein